MKYYEKRKYLAVKIIVLILILIALFFALCDCTPSQREERLSITYERS